VIALAGSSTFLADSALGKAVTLRSRYVGVFNGWEALVCQVSTTTCAGEAGLRPCESHGSG